VAGLGSPGGQELDGGGHLSLAQATPILRIFDEVKAKEFYVEFLGFKVDWEHRFEPGLPLYMQISKDECVLHLSEHHGDCSPGAAMRIQASDLDAFHAELASKQYKYARPGIEEMPWGTRDMSVKDPFGNTLTFTTAMMSEQPGTSVTKLTGNMGNTLFPKAR
jgi:uncharacterized glyoxalase superfamily protein PhnB